MNRGWSHQLRLRVVLICLTYEIALPVSVRLQYHECESRWVQNAQMLRKIAKSLDCVSEVRLARGLARAHQPNEVRETK